MELGAANGRRVFTDFALGVCRKPGPDTSLSKVTQITDQARFFSDTWIKPFFRSWSVGGNAVVVAVDRPHRIQATILDLTSRLRGLYRRVATRMDVHPSYVSRVARGQRRSTAVEAALRREIRMSLARAMKSRRSRSRPERRPRLRSRSK